MLLNNAIICLGSNIGKRSENLEAAFKAIASLPGTKILKKSHFYITSPLGPRQRDFINCAAKIKTALTPDELLSNLKNIEKQMGRKKTAKWGARIIDLDIIFYDNIILKNKLLEIPHPQAERRLFVLLPISEIAPVFIHPVSKKTVRFLLKELMLTSHKQNAKILNLNYE